jgi:hypothetical protein
MDCPNDPTHLLREENFRKEDSGTEYTYFCPSCLIRFNRCTKVRHMSMCEEIAEHSGPHKGRNEVWTEPSDLAIRVLTGFQEAAGAAVADHIKDGRIVLDDSIEFNERGDDAG